MLSALRAGLHVMCERPFALTGKGVERILAAAKGQDGDGLLLYSATAQANGTDGDQLVIGPPFVIGDAEIERIARGTAAAIRAVREG